jgi:hypothetical protein
VASCEPKALHFSTAWPATATGAGKADPESGRFDVEKD